jgi:hypothetical protein
MGNEDPWFLLVGGALALLIVTTVVFIPIKIVQLIARERRNARSE